jgi:hypothetical protein
VFILAAVPQKVLPRHNTAIRPIRVSKRIRSRGGARSWRRAVVASPPAVAAAIAVLSPVHGD